MQEGFIESQGTKIHYLIKNMIGQSSLSYLFLES
jgi:hypothetical protein